MSPLFNFRRGRNHLAFTLLELLVVISIIAILAGLVLSVAGAMKKKRMINVAQTEMNQIQTAIESYKAKLGYYPPDNPGNPVTNQLYFELVGTTLNNATYVTLDGSAQISATPGAFQAVFGAASPVTGFMNSSKVSGSTDDVSTAVDFLKNLRPNQSTSVDPVNSPQVKLLACSVDWAADLFSPLPANLRKNPWRYVSSSPTNNPNSYDLWVDISFGDPSNGARVCNWSKSPQPVLLR